MSKNPNSVLILNQRYGQPLTHFQEAEAQAHREIGGIVNIRTNVRDTDKPYFEYIGLKEKLSITKTEASDTQQPSGPGFVEGLGFFSG